MVLHKVISTLQPGKQIVVDDGDYTDLNRAGVIAEDLGEVEDDTEDETEEEESTPEDVLADSTDNSSEAASGAKAGKVIKTPPVTETI